MKRTLTPLLITVLLGGIAGVALAQAEGGPPEPPPLRLTEEKAAALTQAQDLQKELKIARLELALAEAKDLPEGDIAVRAEHMYRLQGQLYAFHAKHPELAREVRAHQGQQRWRHREGMGRGRGPGMGRGRGQGARGMGPGMGRGGMGREMRGMGFGRGRGFGRGMGPNGGPGRRMMRGRASDPVDAPVVAPPPDFEIEEELRD